MEFIGRIAKLLPARQGVSQRTGNEWKSQPFIFEYFEHDSDRYADSVMLETFDTNVIPHLREGMEVRCGFGHKVREYTKQEGTVVHINDLRLYKIESVARGKQSVSAPAADGGTGAKPAAAQPAKGAAPFPPQVDANGNPITNQGGGDNDLPF